jgi:hypothetical protein
MVGRIAHRPRFARVAGYLQAAIAAAPGDSSFQDLDTRLEAMPFAWSDTLPASKKLVLKPG